MFSQLFSSQYALFNHIAKNIYPVLRCNIWRKIKKFKLRKLKKGSSVNVKIIKFRKTIFQSVPDLLRLQIIREKHNGNQESISDFYMDMTARRHPENTSSLGNAEQEYEIMAYVDFRGGKTCDFEEKSPADESIYEEYAS